MLDAWNAAASCFRSKMRNQQCGRGGEYSNGEHYKCKTRHTPGMSANDEVRAPAIGSVEKQTKRSSNNATKNANGDRQSRQSEKPWRALRFLAQYFRQH